MKKKGIRAAAVSLALLAAMNSPFPAFGATAEEIMAKNQDRYRAGTQSVYGPSLNQDQLNAVAKAAADFKSRYITDTMDNDEKIRAAHDFLKNTVSYIAWDKGEEANNAYGALVHGQAACSGYARAFQSLCDAMDVSCYYIHADGTAGNPSHQWNLTEYNDGFYFVDVEANDSSGTDVVYHAAVHPYSCDMSGLPAIGSKTDQNLAENGNPAVQVIQDSPTLSSNTNGGWLMDNGQWAFKKENGEYCRLEWARINGKDYYFDIAAHLEWTLELPSAKARAEAAIDPDLEDCRARGIQPGERWQSDTHGVWYKKEDGSFGYFFAWQSNVLGGGGDSGFSYNCLCLDGENQTNLFYRRDLPGGFGSVAEYLESREPVRYANQDGIVVFSIYPDGQVQLFHPEGTYSLGGEALLPALYWEAVDSGSIPEEFQFIEKGQ